MMYPQTADGGLQIWGAAANILNKQSQTADKEWSFGVVKPACYEMSQNVLE
jgi:hypothetical protein